MELPALGFVVTDPRLFKPDYRVRVTASHLEGLHMDDFEQARVWVILTIPSDPSMMTANLQGPLVVNFERQLGCQVVLNEEGITTKYPVLAGRKANGRATDN